MPSLSQDRIAGTLLGLACGDALGAGYEFSTPAPDDEIEMRGGGLGPWAPGEWTDDTQMALCIAQVTATGSWDLDAIGGRFLDWHAAGPKDVGVSTSAVLAAATEPADLPEAAATYVRRNPRGAAGNGSLMRTAPVALAHLGDDHAIAAAAAAASAVTHGDPVAGEACVLWCIGIDRAVRERRLDGVRDGLALLSPDRAAFWRGKLDAAESAPPSSFRPNGYVVTALQAAYAAVQQTPVPIGIRARHLQDALVAAVRIGHDTDTVAAIAGSLLGARWGASAIPFRWRRLLHGWPGMRAKDLVRLAVLTAERGPGDGSSWPTARHAATRGEQAWHAALPRDEGVVIGNLAALANSCPDVDAVVSLCRVGTRDVPVGCEHHEVWLVDQEGGDANPNLELVLLDAADAVATLRAEGKRVFLHCVGGRSRTPTVAALYLYRRHGLSAGEALRGIAAVAPYQPHNRSFRGALDRLTNPRGSLEGVVDWWR